MDKWLQQLPKPILVIGALFLGTAFIVISDPPRTVCDIQISDFKESQKGMIFSRKTDSEDEKTRLQRMQNICLQTNSVGGCLEYFRSLRILLGQVDKASYECRPKFFALKKVRVAFEEGIEVLLKAAWGEGPPQEVSDKYGWLEAYDMNLYCRVRDQLIFYRGKENWKKLKLKLLKSLPGTRAMPRQEVLRRSLLSESCKRFR